MRAATILLAILATHNAEALLIVGGSTTLVDTTITERIELSNGAQLTVAGSSDLAAVLGWSNFTVRLVDAANIDYLEVQAPMGNVAGPHGANIYVSDDARIGSLSHTGYLNVDGGIIDNLSSANGLQLDMSGGTIHQGLAFGSVASYLLNISGGTFSNGLRTGRVERADIFLSGETQIVGGISIDQFTYLTLNALSVELFDGFLVGQLSETNHIEIPISFGPNWRGALTINNRSTSVPEPSAMLLLATGLLPLAIRRYRRDRAI